MSISALSITPRGESRVFTLSEAQALFPMVQRLTHEAHEALVPVRQVLETMLPTHPDISVVESEYKAIVQQWMGKMERLGLVVKGLWLVDFDTGDGYLCWKFPELRLGHYHAYHEGFVSRRPLREVIEDQDPDWARL